ncbi:unnamed protein product [Calicophoron daubneyi]
MASRCSAMSSMLLPNAGELMQAARSSHLIKDVEPDIFRFVMRYIYTNRISFITLPTNKLIEILRASLHFQLHDLAKLVEAHLISLIDMDTVFALLNIAVKYKSTELSFTAMSFIVQNAQNLLNASNEGITVLTPAAMLTILKSDDLPVNELTLFRMAAYWAEEYLYAETSQISLLRSQSSQLGRSNPSQRSSHSKSLTNIYKAPRSSFFSPVSPRKRRARAYRAVWTVMSEIRFALLNPTELKEIEADEELKRLIPPRCLADAWRILTFKHTNSHADEKLTITTSLPRRRAHKPSSARNEGSL